MVAGRGLKPPDLRLRLFAARDLIVSDLTGFYLLHHDMMSEPARFRLGGIVPDVPLALGS